MRALYVFGLGVVACGPGVQDAPDPHRAEAQAVTAPAAPAAEEPRYRANEAPAPVDDHYTAERDTELVVPAPGVLSNDSDDGPAPLTASIAPFGDPDIGSVALAADGSFLYTPGLCYQGLDTFQYRATDGNGRFTKASATVEVGTDAPHDAEYCDAYTPIEPAFLGSREHYDVGGLPAWHIVPPKPRGLVLMFHGSGADTDARYMEQFALDVLTDELYQRGFASAALSSRERFPADWVADKDWPVIVQFRDQLIEQTELTDTTPLVILGMSGGGSFVPPATHLALDEGWDVRVMAIHIASPRGTPDDMPVFWFGGENDPRISPAQIQDAFDAHDGPKELYIHREIVLHPMYFRRHVEYTHQDSLDNFNELIRLGGIDADGNRLVPPEDMKDFSNFYGANSTAKQPGRAGQDLRPAWAGHTYHENAVIAEADYIEQWFDPVDGDPGPNPTGDTDDAQQAAGDGSAGGGCGCATSGPAGLGWLALPLLVLYRSRR